MRVTFVVLITLVFASSCTFNRQCYKPDKIPANFRRENIVTTPGDTTFLNIGKGFQPSFTDIHGAPLPLKYTFESITFKNNAGNNLVGWFISPKEKAQPAITVVFLHGNGGNLLTEFWSALQLVKQGLQVFIFDYRGYGWSEGKSTRQGVLCDVTDALTMIRARADVKDTKLVLYGQSMGAQLAGVAAAGHDSLVDAVVMEGGPSSYKDIAAYWYRPIGLLARVLIRNEYSATKAISHYHKPLLIIHSSEDKTAPIFMGRKVYAHANTPKSFYEIKHGHIEGLRYYSDSIATRIKNMVKD